METKINAVYLRVSTENQSIEMQLHAIKQFLQIKGITNYQIYQDEGESGSKTSRPALNKLLNDVNQGKVELLCVYKLDRLFRSLSHLISTLKHLSDKNVLFVSVTESMDLSTAHGRLMMQLIGAFAEFERNLVSQRTKAGLAHARANGVKFGAPEKISLETRVKVLDLRQAGLSYNRIAKECSISNCMAHRIVKKNNAS